MRILCSVSEGDIQKQCLQNMENIDASVFSSYYIV